VTEPTALKVCVAHKGFAWVKLQVFGRAAHGSRPDLGVDAIVGISPVLGEIRRLNERLAETRHPLLGAASVHASTIEGGQELSSYPAVCTLQLERRMLPGEASDAVDRDLAGLERAAAGVDVNAKILLRRDPFCGGHPTGMGLPTCFPERRPRKQLVAVPASERMGCRPLAELRHLRPATIARRSRLLGRIETQRTSLRTAKQSSRSWASSASWRGRSSSPRISSSSWRVMRRRPHGRCAAAIESSRRRAKRWAERPRTVRRAPLRSARLDS